MATRAVLTQYPDVLIAVKLKGRATASSISDVVGFEATTTLDALTADGLLEAGTAFYKVTPAGLDVVADALAAVRATVGDAMVTTWYESFCSINGHFKATITDWQLRMVDGVQAINDHSDAQYDESVLYRLQRIHAEITTLLEGVHPSYSRSSRYHERLAAALERIEAGQLEYMASPAVDSYHSVWFELHEELILLSGRTRAAEAEAGRG